MCLQLGTCSGSFPGNTYTETGGKRVCFVSISRLKGCKEKGVHGQRSSLMGTTALGKGCFYCRDKNLTQSSLRMKRMLIFSHNQTEKAGCYTWTRASCAVRSRLFKIKKNLLSPSFSLLPSPPLLPYCPCPSSPSAFPVKVDSFAKWYSYSVKKDANFL